MVVSDSSFAQDSQDNVRSQDSLQNNTSIPKRLFVTDLYLQRGIPTGDNFAGNGLEGGIGYGVRMQFYLPKNFYLGGSLTQDFMNVTNTAIAGEYSRATKFNAYLFAGYDYDLNDYWGLTGDIGYGYSQNKNRQNSSQGNGKFRDTGNVLRITTSAEYKLNSSTSFYISPSFEMVSYNIKTARELQNRFDNANYFNVAIGVRLSSRDYSSVPLNKTDNQELIELQNRNREELSIKEKRRLYFLKKREERRLRRERRRRNR
ncbi:hypothetical protein DDD_3363 [Nonlabens dokdonensis DSW-6]|uniref:Outer membrane protein beta-barrel domain-containing protein n=1 Tax=Nonlabens dokdonensis (strain DSM 17205 / KCTC 12402 / DSW-6) TaxID=592029 RepID=L7W9Y5_NONDD|nr:hypothetical protein DDD_3363 [Nonlabens dokdonensis DSW-6]